MKSKVWSLTELVCAWCRPTTGPEAASLSTAQLLKDDGISIFAVGVKDNPQQVCAHWTWFCMIAITKKNTFWYKTCRTPGIFGVKDNAQRAGERQQ